VVAEIVVAAEVFFGLLIGACALYFVSIMIYLPITGQSAFIPTYRWCVDHILKEAPIEGWERFVDLGAGDCRVLVAVERMYGIRAEGFEINPFAYAVGRVHLWLRRSRAKLIFANFHKADLSGYDVIYCYLTPFVQKRLFPKFKTNAKPGALIISRIYTVGDWKPFRTLQYIGPNGPEATYFYRVPKREESPE
jgi:hypothetical protein